MQPSYGRLWWDLGLLWNIQWPASTSAPDLGSVLTAHLVKCEMICERKKEENFAEVESSLPLPSMTVVKIHVCVNIELQSDSLVVWRLLWKGLLWHCWGAEGKRPVNNPLLIGWWPCSENVALFLVKFHSVLKNRAEDFWLLRRMRKYSQKVLHRAWERGGGWSEESTCCLIIDFLNLILCSVSSSWNPFCFTLRPRQVLLLL